MTISQIYDFIKQYIDTKISEASVALKDLFSEYKTKEVGEHLDEIRDIRLRYVGAFNKYPTTRIDGSPLQAGDFFFDINTKSYKTYDGNMWIDLVGGQYSDSNKGIGYLANHSEQNENIIIQQNINAYSVDNYNLQDGATITIEDGATYKIL